MNSLKERHEQRKVEYSRSARLLNDRFKQFMIPMLITSVSVSLATVIDSILVGHFVGAEEMACVGICANIIEIFLGFSDLFAVGAEEIISIAIGRRDRELANKAFSCAVALLVGLSILLAVLGLVFIDPLLEMLSGDAHMRELMKPFLRITIIGAPLCILLPAIMHFFEVDGTTKLVAWAEVVCQVVNIGLAVVFMEFMKIGVAGAALATQIGYIAGLLVLFFGSKAFKKLSLKPINTLRLKAKDWGEQIGEMLKYGSASSIGVFLIPLKTLLVYRILQDVGGPEAAEIFSASNFGMDLVWIIIDGLSSAMIPIVGCLYGEKDLKGIRLIAKHVLLSTVILCGITLILLMLFPMFVFKLYGVSPEVAAGGITPMRLYSISLLGHATSCVLVYYYSSIDKIKASLLLNLVEGLLVIVPAAYLMSRKWGINGVFYAFILAELVTIVVMFIYTHFINKSGKKSTYPSLYLLGTDENRILYDISSDASVENAVGIARDAIETMKTEGVEASLANIAGLSLEEMIDNMCNYSHADKKKIHLDARITESKDGLLISFRDDGDAFNPVEYRPEEKEQFHFDNISVIKALAKDIKYDRHLSFNQTVILV